MTTPAKREAISRSLRRYIQLLNQERFFEAHEALEPDWLAVKKSQTKTSRRLRDFYQGLIQIAAALVHLERGTPQGARVLLQSAARYLEGIPSPLMGLDHQDLLATAERCLTPGRNPLPKILH